MSTKVNAPHCRQFDLKSSYCLWGKLLDHRDCRKKRMYKTRDIAGSDIFEYMEMFYNPKRSHSHPGSISLRGFERSSFLDEERRQFRGKSEVTFGRNYSHLLKDSKYEGTLQLRMSKCNLASYKMRH